MTDRRREGGCCMGAYLIRRRDVISILEKEYDMSVNEKQEASNERDIAFNSGEIHCAKRVRSQVINLPTVDAVPVVRCRECKRRGGYKCPMYHTETSLDDLDGFDDYNIDKTDDDGFCHRGEKKC